MGGCVRLERALRGRVWARPPETQGIKVPCQARCQQVSAFTVIRHCTRSAFHSPKGGHSTWEARKLQSVGKDIVFKGTLYCIFFFFFLIWKIYLSETIKLQKVLT